MPTKQLSGLATVQHLYVLQVELLQLVRGGLQTPDRVKEAKKQLKEFDNLLKKVDPDYMGGEEVLDGLQLIRRDVSSRVARGSKTKSKATKAKKVVKTKKPVAKKAVKKKKK